jgi:small-conductance mechanosensitive channel
MHPSPETLPDFELWFLNSATDLVAAVLILIAGWIASRWAGRWTQRGLSRVHHFDETLKPLLSSFVRYAILIATFIAVLQRFGVETTSFIALVGAAGVAVGLALQGTLSNVAAGVMLLVLRPFRVGDGIQAAGQSGTVREIGLFTTILVSDDLAYVSVPNASIFNGVIVNNSREPNRRINFIVSIDFSNEIDTAQKIVLDVLRGDPRVLVHRRRRRALPRCTNMQSTSWCVAGCAMPTAKPCCFPFRRRSRTVFTRPASPSPPAVRRRPREPNPNPPRQVRPSKRRIDRFVLSYRHPKRWNNTGLRSVFRPSPNARDPERFGT